MRRDFRNWHETDMPQWSLYVRSWGQSGKHMLAMSFSGFDPKRTSGAGQPMSTDGWQFSGDAVRFLQGGQWPRCARKALSAEFRSEARRRSRQMVPHSMNGAYSDRGSQESFAIRLPDATIQSERVSHWGRYGAGTALGRCTKPAGGR